MVVTGGASGIGRGVCDEFVKRSGRVVIFDVQEELGRHAIEELGEEIPLHPSLRLCDASSLRAGGSSRV
jgi:NAD(P)-dependent dehydrogenase (short-subunit alcohol dehydrogenase family)